MYTVYILKSINKKRYYIGCTKDVKRRLKEHNEGKTRSTKGHAPWRIVYTEEYDTSSEAFKREKEIKSYKSGIKLKKLLGLK